MWKIFFFFVSSLSKFTFSTSDRILCKIKKKKGANKLNLIQTLRSPPLHKVLVWSSSCTVAHSSKWILYLHIYVLCTTTGNVCLKKRAFCLLNIKCVPASWQRHVSVKKQSTPTQTLLRFRLQSQSYYHYSQPFWILHHHCPIPPPTLLNYSATIAAGPGPSIRSAQGEGWWLTVCNRVHLDSYRPLELRQTTVLEPLGRIWLMLWGVFGCEVALTVKIYELLAAFSLLGELGEEEEEEEGEKFIPDSPGGSVAVFWPLRLFLHTGHVSCCQKQREKEYFQYSLQKGDIPL